MSDTTNPQPQKEFRFEVAIPFGTEPYRSPAYLPHWLNPWRYRARRRARANADATADENWSDWNINDDGTVPGEFTPYAVQVRETDGVYVYERVCKVDISTSEGDEAHTRLKDGLSQIFNDFTVRPFKSERFMAQVGTAQFEKRYPIPTGPPLRNGDGESR